MIFAKRFISDVYLGSGYTTDSCHCVLQNVLLSAEGCINSLLVAE